MADAKPTKADEKLAQLALTVKRGERTYAELSDTDRPRVREYLRTTPTRVLREMAQANREARKPHRVGRPAFANVRS